MITSTRNPKIARAVKLKKRASRNEEGVFLVEGAQSIAEALAPNGPGLEELYVTDELHPVAARARELGVDVETVAEQVMARLTSTVTPQGLVAVAKFLDVELESLPQDLPAVAVLCAVRDPGNAGTVLRSADASGAGGVVFSTESVDPYNPKTVRASAGSIFHLPVVRSADTAGTVSSLRSRGASIYAMTSDGERDLYDLDLSGPVAFLFGNEAWGLSAEVAALADVTVRVPISNRAESLNLAAAASVCLFEAARQRNGPQDSARDLREREDLETLIAASAHDIRSPVTGIRSLAMTLQERGDSLTSSQRAMLIAGVVHDSERVDLLIRQLVDAARVQSGHFEAHFEETKIDDVVEELVEFNRIDSDHPAILYGGESVSVPADRVRLRQALAALVEAEIWFAQKGPIEVRAEHSNRTLVIEVSRADPTVTRDEAEQLFFPRMPGTGSGSKIGLYVTRSVAEAMGGSATVQTGENLVFRLTLPVGG